MTRRHAWAAFIVACLAAALYAAGVVTVRRVQSQARADERARMTVENNTWTRAQLETQRAHFRRIVDSLGAQVAARDSALRVRIVRVRDVPRWLPADTTPAVQLRACRAQLDTLATDCEVFRAQAAATLEGVRAAADSVHRADSAAAAQAGMRAVLAVAEREEFGRRLASAQRGRAWERGACAVSGALNLFTLWRVTK